MVCLGYCSEDILHVNATRVYKWFAGEHQEGSAALWAWFSSICHCKIGHNLATIIAAEVGIQVMVAVLICACNQICGYGDEIIDYDKGGVQADR